MHDVIAIGNSMGASNFWAYLAQYGKGRLAAMIDLDQSPKMIADASWHYGFKDLTWMNYPDYLKRPFGKSMYAKIDEEMFESAKAEYVRFPYKPFDNFTCLIDHAEQDWRDVVLDMPVPMLIVAGKNSPYFDYHFTDAVKKLNSQVETAVIDNCGHLIQAEQPIALHDVVMRFLHDKGLAK